VLLRATEGPAKIPPGGTPAATCLTRTGFPLGSEGIVEELIPQQRAKLEEA
jgi:hypothetical protein